MTSFKPGDRVIHINGGSRAALGWVGKEGTVVKLLLESDEAKVMFDDPSLGLQEPFLENLQFAKRYYIQQFKKAYNEEIPAPKN